MALQCSSLRPRPGPRQRPRANAQQGSDIQSDLVERAVDDHSSFRTDGTVDEHAAGYPTTAHRPQGAPEPNSKGAQETQTPSTQPRGAHRRSRGDRGTHRNLPPQLSPQRTASLGPPDQPHCLCARHRPRRLGAPARSSSGRRGRSVGSRRHVPPGHRALSSAQGTIYERITRSRARWARPSAGAPRRQADQQPNGNSGCGIIRTSRAVHIARHHQSRRQRTPAVRLSDVVRRAARHLRRRGGTGVAE